MNKREKGTEYEAVAAQYLKERGYEIICLNYRCRIGEIDIIAKDGEYLVFVEVKYRRNERMGSPFEAVDFRKQQKILKVSQWYLVEQRIGDVPIRYDVVGILDKDVKLIKNAF